MPIASDFEIDRATGNIRHTSGSTNYTVLELHRYLQDLADDAAAAGDDELDITDVTPSERSTDNIITLINGYNIDDTAAQYLYDGSITQDDGDTIYAGIVVVGTVVSGTQLQVIQNNSVYTSFWSTGINADSTANIITRMLIKVRSGGSDVDGKRLRIQAREFGNTYSEFSMTCGLGNNTAAIFTVSDLNNQTASGTVSGWSITNTEGYQNLDVNNDSVNEQYYSQWDRGSQSMNQLYEYTKYLTRRGTSSTLYGLNGFLFRGITHSIAYSAKTGTPTQNETVSWGSGATAGTGKLLAFSGGSTGTIYIQLLTGVIVTTGTITGGSSGATWTYSSATQRTVSTPFIGTSTGSAIIGAYGVGIKTSTLSSSDLLTALDGTAYTPPNNVTFTVSGLVSGDRVLVAPWDGSSTDGQGNPVPNTTQYTLSGNLTSGSVSSVTVSGSIAADTPSSGTIRVVNNSGYRVRLAYSSWSGSTFTLSSTYAFNGSNETANASSGNGVYVTYIDKATSSTSESFGVVYSTNRNLVVRVRNGSSPIKTFITSATLGSAGGSSTAIRTSDS